MKYKKFCSSGSVGGEFFRCRALKMDAKTPVQAVKDDIVSRLRERAEHYEYKAENATPGRCLELTRVAKEFRDFAVSIRLNDWNDSDEI